MAVTGLSRMNSTTRSMMVCGSLALRFGGRASVESTTPIRAIRVAAAPATTAAPRRQAPRRSGLPTDVDINGNARRRRPKQRVGATGGSGRTASGFLGKSAAGAKPGSGSKSGGNYGTGRQRRQAD
jgi:hypothetical protein